MMCPSWSQRALEHQMKAIKIYKRHQTLKHSKKKYKHDLLERSFDLDQIQEEWSHLPYDTKDDLLLHNK